MYSSAAFLGFLISGPESCLGSTGTMHINLLAELKNEVAIYLPRVFQGVAIFYSVSGVLSKTGGRFHCGDSAE